MCLSLEWMPVPAHRRGLRRMLGLGGLLLLAVRLDAGDPEPHALVLEERILSNAAVVRAAVPEARLVAVWDFDGTLLKGDCSEGLVEDGRTVYPGLAELCVARGFAAHYRGGDGFARLWDDYRYLDNRVGHWLAYPYLVQALAGAPEAEVRQLSRETFERVYAPHLFASSLHIFKRLREAGIENVVISASAEVFVDGAAGVLGVSERQIHGIRVRVSDGRLTRELVYPVTFAEGKRAALETLLAGEQGRPAFALAAFGNSYSTDGAFLRFVADQRLPSGETTAVMINGGVPPADVHPRFILVEQKTTVGE